jgi:flagellar biosynthesis/type III secretory pathway chaperone
VAEELLKSLIEIMKEEKKHLLKFPWDEPEAYVKIQEKKRELLLKVSQLERKELEGKEELLKEIKTLNEEIKRLLINNLEFIEEVLSALYSTDATYGTKEKTKSLFGRSV